MLNDCEKKAWESRRDRNESRSNIAINKSIAGEVSSLHGSHHTGKISKNRGKTTQSIVVGNGIIFWWATGEDPSQIRGFAVSLLHLGPQCDGLGLWVKVCSPERP